jgi:hypothetical protein
LKTKKNGKIGGGREIFRTNTIKEEKMEKYGQKNPKNLFIFKEKKRKTKQ